MNRYNFRTVIAMNILYSKLHTTPFVYGKIYFGVLHMHDIGDTRSDTPWDSNPQHLPVGALKSLQI